MQAFRDFLSPSEGIRGVGDFSLRLIDRLTAIAFTDINCSLPAIRAALRLINVTLCFVLIATLGVRAFPC